MIQTTVRHTKIRNGLLELACYALHKTGYCTAFIQYMQPSVAK